MKPLNFRSIFVCSLFILFNPITAQSLPINSDLGLTPHKDELIVRVQGRYLTKTGDPSGQNREVEVYSVPVVMVYGFTSKASMLVKIPFLVKEMKTGTGSIRGDEGLGDITVLGKYRVHTRNFKGGTSRLSLIAGLELPTGEDNERDSLGLLPPGLQLGSGSVDIIVGAAHTIQTLDYEVDTDLRYIINNEANGFEFGNVFQYNLSLQKRIFPFTLPDGMYDQFNVLVEFNGIYQGKNEVLGIDQSSSGGHTLFISPGLQYVTQRIIYEASFQYPIVQNLNGAQLETDYRLALSLRVQF